MASVSHSVTEGIRQYELLPYHKEEQDNLGPKLKYKRGTIPTTFIGTCP